MKVISRRDVLKRLAVGGLLAHVPAFPAWASAPARGAPLAKRLAGLFSNLDSAAEVGRRYLALGAEPANTSLLAARVAGGRAAYLRLCAADGRGLRTLLAQQQRRDFASGRTVSIDGWVLSLTEARLCAIAALVRSSR